MACLLFAVAGSAVLGSCGSVRAPHTSTGQFAPSEREQFGASVNRIFNDRALSGPQIARQLSALRRTGASVARSDALWEAIESEPPAGSSHHYDWRFDDALVESLARNHLRWLPVVDYTPAWAQTIPGVEHSPPVNASDFAAFAQALARRYGPAGTFWQLHQNVPALPVDLYEVWNEPDNPQFWKPAPDPTAYAALYSKTRAAVRSVDPAARVIVGGLTRPAQFMPALVASAPILKKEIDGIGIHPYAATPQGVTSEVRGSRSLLRALGLPGVPLYVTEFGWVTSPRDSRYWAPARLRPLYLQETVAALAHTNCGVGAVIVYTWRTPERNPADQEDWFGIHPPEDSNNSDTAGFTAGLRLARAPAAPLRVC